MVIPCLCLFVALSSLFSELVGAKPLHLLTQTVLLLVQTQTSDKQKSTRTLFHKESGSGMNCMVDGTGLEQHVPSAAKAIKALAGL